MFLELAVYTDVVGFDPFLASDVEHPVFNAAPYTLAGLGAAIFSIPALSLAVSAMFILLMSGLILYQTSAMVNGGETNYILATVGLYVSIYNLFLSLLQLLGAFAGED